MNDEKSLVVIFVLGDKLFEGDKGIGDLSGGKKVNSMRVVLVLNQKLHLNEGSQRAVFLINNDNNF